MNVINLYVNAINCLILVTLMVLTVNHLESSVNRRSFLALLFNVLMFNLTDFFAWLFEGTDPAWKIAALRIDTFVYYLFTPLMYIAFMKFIRNILRDKYVNNWLYIACMVPCFISVFGSFASCFPGFLYSFTAENAYARSSYYPLHFINIFVFFIFVVLYLISNRRKVSKKTLWTLLSFPTLPTLAYIPQLLFYGLATVNIGLVVSMITLYVNLRKDIQLGGSQILFDAAKFRRKEKISFAERFRRFISSYSFSDEAIRSIKNEVRDTVTNGLQVVSKASGILTAVLFVLSFFVPRFQGQRFIYLGVTILCIALSVFLRCFKRHNAMTIMAGYLFFILIFGVNIYKNMAISPDQTPVLFACVLCLAPLVFCDRPYIIWLIEYAFVFVFLDLARFYRPAESLRSNAVYLLLVTTLGIILGYGMSKMRITSIYLTKNLDDEVGLKSNQLKAMAKEIVTTLTSSIESKDEYTNGHSERVADYAVLLAFKLGWTEEQCDALWMEAILHDIGKIGVPDSILAKTEKLTDEEVQIIQSHTVDGAHILENLSSFPGAKATARYHHEKVNGEGYPEGLKGDAIPEAARIVAIADAYDAMTTNRSYRQSLSDAKVMEELKKGRGIQFDPVYLDAFLTLLRENGGSLIMDRG